jgi:Family of unknown function (DUF5719)
VRGRFPVAVACAVALAGVGVAVTLRPATNPAAAPGASSSTETTALYCTGLQASAHRPGRVTYLNTSGGARAVALEVVSDTGRVVSRSLELAAHSQYSFQPTTLEAGAFYAVAARVTGSGVVADEVPGTARASAPCATVGTTRWAATGFDTRVGSSAYVSVYNPTATSAVFNTAVYTAAGFTAPQAYQGVTVPAHAERVLNLAGQAVNAVGVGVALNVLRGSLVVVGVEDDQGTLSLNPGQAGAATRAYFPAVTTVAHATAQLLVANPGADPAEVSVRVALGRYAVATQHLTVAPYSTGSLSITPNSAIPAEGYAALSVSANTPVVVDLATGSGAGLSLSAPSAATRAALVHDFTGQGFDALEVLNPSGRELTVRVTVAGSSTPVATVRVAAHAASDLAAAAPAMRAGPAVYLVTGRRPFALGETLPSRPAGVVVVSALDGR